MKRSRLLVIDFFHKETIMRMLQLVCLYVTYGTLAAVSTPIPLPLVCDSNGTLTYNYAGRQDWVHSASSDCGAASVNDTTKAVIVKGCKLGKAAIVTLYSLNSTPTPMPIVSLKDAKENVIVLKCNRAPDGATHTATLIFPGSVTPTSFTANEQIELKMTLTNVNDAATPSNVVIGKKYRLHISGAGTHYMKIVNCTADSKEPFTAKSVTIYKFNPADTLGIIDVSTPTPVPTTVPTPAPTAAPDTYPLVVTMTGFRLVGSNSVYLHCAVKVCDKRDCPAAKRKGTKPGIRTAGLHFEAIGIQTRLSANSAIVIEMYAAWKLTVTFAIVAVANYLAL